MNSLPENAVRIEYPGDALEASSSALFLVRNFSFRNEFGQLSADLKQNITKEYCNIERGEFLVCRKGRDWCRTYVIEACLPKIRVFFIDYAICGDIGYSYNLCQPLLSIYGPEALESQSYKISPYGLTPLTVNIPLLENSDEPRKIPCDYWEPYQVSFMKKQMTNAKRIFFQSVFQEGEIKFGYIFVEKNRKFYSLNNLLIENESAVVCGKEDFEKNKIPTLVDYFRRERTFDRELSVRKKLWPNASFMLEKEECIPPVEETSILEHSGDADEETHSRSSSLSNYVSFPSSSPNSWEFDVPPESVNNVRPTSSRSGRNVRAKSAESLHSSSTTVNHNRAPKRTRTPIENVDDSNRVIRSNEDETLENGSENIVPKNEAYADYAKEAIMPAFSRMRDEILIVGNENYFEPEVTFGPILDDKTRSNMRNIGIRDINRCQGYMIPAMLSRVPKDIFLVDAPGSGKTVACLIALVSLLRETNANKRVTCGPRSIFVLPYSARCEFVRDRCAELIAGRKGDKLDEELPRCDLRIAIAYGCGADLERRNMNTITRGCDVLVCTPRCLLRLMQNDVGFDLSQLEYAIFDEFHILGRSFKEEMMEIMRAVRDLRRKNLRRVFISNTSRDIKPIWVDSSAQMVLIPCMLEAAIFVNFYYEILYREDESRIIPEIKERLCSNWKSKIVVLLLNDDEESLDKMIDIESALRACGKPIHQFKPYLSMIDLDEKLRTLRYDISCGEKPLILSTDFALNSLQEKIYDADCLLHYSLPADVRTFRRRFSVILHRLQDIAHTSTEPSTSTPSGAQKPQVVLYIDKYNAERIPRLLNIMSQLRTDTPSWARELHAKIEHHREMRKPELCLNLKLFGRCGVKETCKRRHVLVAAKDQPDPLLPRTGHVKIDIVHVYGPTHFRARLLQHRTVNAGEWKQLPIMSTATLAIKLDMYYGKNKPRSVDGVREGDLLAVQDTDAKSTLPCYRRVRVMKVIDEKPQKAVLKFVDMGKETIRNVAALCQLPSELAAVPETTIDVFVCNLQPIDEDIMWGKIFTDLIQRRINEQRAAGHTFIGKIQLVVGRSMWLDPLQCESYSKQLQTERVEFWFTRYLLTEKLALKNPQHLQVLRQMCEDAGIDYSQTNVANGTNSDGGGDASDEVPSDNKNDSSPSKNVLSKLNSSNHRNAATARDRSSPPHSNLRIEKYSHLNKPPLVVNRRKNNEVSRRPPVYWRQDKSSISLTIRKNCDRYIVRHDGFRRLYFEGWEGDTLYEFEEELSQCFDGETLQHKKSGVTVFIKADKLIKNSDFKWTRLLKRRDRVSWVKEEIDSLLDEDSDSGMPIESVRQYSTQKSRDASCLLEEKLGYKPRPDDLSENSSDTDADDSNFLD